MKLLVLVPSRGRPANARRLLNAFSSTCTEGDDVGMMLCTDRDDPTLPDYPAGLVHGDHPTMIEKLNAAAMLTLDMDPPTYLGFMGDDHLPRTEGWDARVVEALDGLPGPGIVYCDDLFQHEAMPTAVFMHAAIVEALGWMALPTLGHLYCDNAWLDLGHALGNVRYLGDVVIEHLHPSAGTAENDDQYDRVNSAERYHEDRAAWLEWREHQLPADVDAIRQQVAA
jgi:hypothetical protein